MPAENGICCCEGLPDGLMWVAWAKRPLKFESKERPLWSLHERRCAFCGQF